MAKSERWKVISPSVYQHERGALDFLKAGLPDHEPYRAWSNFEFPDGGRIYEVDALVLTKQGLWLVEIKSAPGTLTGDFHSWVWDHEGRRFATDNPLRLTNTKAKALKSLLAKQPALAKHRMPFVEAVVFLSSEQVDCQLQGTARDRIFLRDRVTEDGQERPGILAAMIDRKGAGIEPTVRTSIDKPFAKALGRAIEQAGIRPSQKARRVGEYVLGDLLEEGPGYQDHRGTHASLEGITSRIRRYLFVEAASEEERQRLRRAAEREYRALKSLDHPCILTVEQFCEHEYGPALLFRDDPDVVRLDHYLTTHGQELTADARLAILRGLGDAIRYAHHKKIVHRALSPASILVRPGDDGLPRVQVYNWQLSRRESASTLGGTQHLSGLADKSALVYTAPEARQGLDTTAEAADVFSLGAIAYRLFTGKPPAEDIAALAQKLAQQNGLRVSDVLDGAGPALQELIAASTAPDVLDRIESAEDFLSLLSDVEDELTAPDTDDLVEPLQARRGDRLAHGLEVVKVLGSGSTAKALLVRRGDQDHVLKVALKEEDNDRLRQEGEVLEQLRSEYVVGLTEVLELGGRVALLLEKAGEESLAARLRQEGSLGLELLERFGEHLLSGLAYLERAGVPHRDIKPDNLAIRSLHKQQLQLVLFDFSLSRAPYDDIGVGTPAYLDPFLPLRKPARWDVQAEHYSAGVTLYEMATGVLPKWGDGRSDPASTQAELALEADRFEARVREPLVAFFEQALHRDAKQRFDNAEEMLRAWRHAFESAEAATKKKDSKGQQRELLFDDVGIDTLIAMLALSTRAENALDRVGVTTVRELLELPIGEIRFMRGVGKKTRDELVRTIASLRDQFPDVEEKVAPTSGDDPASLPLEALVQRLLGRRPKGGSNPYRVRAALLAHPEEDDAAISSWPSQAELSDSIGITRGRVGQVLQAERKRLLKDPAVTALRQDALEALQSSGGVMTADELAELLGARRASGGQAPEPQHATAAARAALEAEHGLAEPRFQLYRRKGEQSERLIVAVSSELATWAVRLGKEADELAQKDPPLPPVRALERLRLVRPPTLPEELSPAGADRLLRLAARASEGAAVSAKGELYPRGMAAARALRLSLGALSGLGGEQGQAEFRPEEVQRRVAARYPEAAPLPDRPELDGLLAEAGFDVRWDARTSSYHREVRVLNTTSGSSILPRRPTVQGRRMPVKDLDPGAAEARDFEARLVHARKSGAFLVLSVRPSALRRCEQELLRRFDLERVSGDREIITELRRLAGEHQVAWSVVQEADGAEPITPDWRNLVHLAREAVGTVTNRLLEREAGVLLVHAGLLARYDQMRALERLRDESGRPEKCPCVWVLVPQDAQTDLPTLDGKEIPLISPGQRARVPEPWLENIHRGERVQA